MGSIIDGDFVETFLQQHRTRQLEVIRKFTASASVKHGDEVVLADLLLILQVLRKTH